MAGTGALPGSGRLAGAWALKRPPGSSRSGPRKPRPAATSTDGATRHYCNSRPPQALAQILTSPAAKEPTMRFLADMTALNCPRAGLRGHSDTVELAHCAGRSAGTWLHAPLMTVPVLDDRPVCAGPAAVTDGPGRRCG